METKQEDNKLLLLEQNVKNLADLYNHQHKRVVILETALLHIVNSIDPQQAESIKNAIKS